MLRPLLVVMAVAVAAPLFAQPKKEPALKVGDQAPPLAVDKWLTGTEVKGFEKGTVYVLSFLPPGEFDFPAAMVALSDLHDNAAGKAVVVGVQSQIFPGPKLGDKELAKKVEYATTAAKMSGASYPLAWENEKKLFDAYVTAVGLFKVGGFVIDKEGKVAYFGPAGTAAYVAERVVNDTWKGKADLDALTKATADLEKHIDAVGPKLNDPDKLDEKGLKALRDDLTAVDKRFKDDPFLLTDDRTWRWRLYAHLTARNYDAVDGMLTTRIATATKRKNSALLSDLDSAFNNRTPTPELSKLVAKLTDALAGLLDPKKAAAGESRQWITLVVLSRKYGHTAKADAYLKTIVDAAPADERKEVEERVKQRLKDAGVGDK